jgi:hypothetical protein
LPWELVLAFLAGVLLTAAVAYVALAIYLSRMFR